MRKIIILILLLIVNDLISANDVYEYIRPLVSELMPDKITKAHMALGYIADFQATIDDTNFKVYFPQAPDFTEFNINSKDLKSIIPLMKKVSDIMKCQMLNLGEEIELNKNNCIIKISFTRNELWDYYEIAVKCYKK